MNVRQILKEVEQPYLKSHPVSFRPGDTVKVYVKVVEGESERIQPFEGIVLKKGGSGLSETFTVRKISFGIGVERTFSAHSPRIDKIEVLKSGKVRRARLFYLRKLSGKAARLSEKESPDAAIPAEPREPAPLKPQAEKPVKSAEPVTT